MKSIFIYLLLLAALFVRCTSKRTETKILYYTVKEDIQEQEQLQQTVEASGMEMVVATELNSLREDSLKQFSSILIAFSALNKMDHRGLTSLKRYFEAGGGGVVAIKDTALEQSGWPWLQFWSNLQPNKVYQQDKAALFILESNFQKKDVQTVLNQAVGENRYPDYTRATSQPVPDSSRYTYQILSQGLDEPMQMAILPHNNVLFVERKGAVKLYDTNTKQTKIIANINVFSGIEDGLLGVALDPDFSRNNWVYFYYAVAGEKAINRLSRMELKGDKLDQASEKVLLEIPTQRKYCCHSAGYIHFGPDGLLYLSVGDNTNAEETEGYVPIDERPGRTLADDQATAANTNDLKGKILRIKPEADGTYSIPEGNLFPPGTPKTRPEIFSMGHRNPYRFSVDMKNGFVYAGDIGPDTKVPSSEGTLSFDEINQIRNPGFFGWPYFLGNNEAFPDYDFATKKEGPKFNPLKPINDSPNNTGIRELPPAQPAMIWYGDGISLKFPLVGKGGESAMAGPVYYSDLFPDAKFKLPRYYDGKLFIYDWVRRWLMAVTFDDSLNYLRMEPFLDHIQFSAPTDMKFAQDGSIYILEYGTNWFAKNSDAKLVRIEYAEGNRKPVANIRSDKLYGPVPLKVQLSAAGSKDFDKDDHLQYKWLIEGKEVRGEQISHSFDKPGAYTVALTVADHQGETNTSTLEIKVGNEPPVVDILTKSNRSFYWSDQKLDYKVAVSDLEDEVIDSSRVNITFNFLPQGKDVAVALTRSQSSRNLQWLKGQQLLDKLDCKACHSPTEESVGPSFTAIAERYAGEAGVEEKLANKIIEGGSGNWGQRTMSSHPDLTKNDAKEIVQYILSFGEPNKSLPLQGSLVLNDHIGKGNEGSYLLMANYTDKGANQIEALAGRSYIALQSPLVQIEDFDEGNVKLGTFTTESLTFAMGISHGSFVKYNQTDLTHVESIRYRLQEHGAGGNIEVRLDRKDGPIVSTLTVPAGKVEDIRKNWKEVTAPLKSVQGKHDVFLIFSNEKEQKQNLFNIDWLYFANEKIRDLH